MNLYIVLVDRQDAYLVKDLSVDKVMKRILGETNVTSSIKVMSADNAMKLADHNVLQIHSCEIEHFTLY